MTRSSLILLFACAVAGAPAGAAGATLNFDDLAFFNYKFFGSGPFTPPAATVITDQFKTAGVIFGRPGVSTGVSVVQELSDPEDLDSANTLAPSSPRNSVAGLDAAGMIPRGVEPDGTLAGPAVGDIFFSFVVPGTTTPGTASGISFTVGDVGGDVDLYEIRAFGLDGALLSSQSVAAVSRIGFPLVVDGVHRVEIDFTGAFGYSLDDLTFTIATPGGSLPAPMSLGLLGLGLCAVAVGRAVMGRWGRRRLRQTLLP